MTIIEIEQKIIDKALEEAFAITQAAYEEAALIIKQAEYKHDQIIDAAESEVRKMGVK